MGGYSLRGVCGGGPFLFGLLLDRVGVNAVWLSAGLCIAAFGSLFALRPRREVAARSSPARG